jgi:hypothetical protein
MKFLYAIRSQVKSNRPQELLTRKQMTSSCSFPMNIHFNQLLDYI